MKTLIFDFGNVVGFFDHRRTLDRLVAFTDMSAREMFEDIYTGRLEEEFESGRIGEVEFLATFIERCRLRCDADYLAAAIADIFWPNPEVCGLLPKLKSRYRLLLGSNTNPIHSRHFVRQFADVLSHFDALVLSHEIGVRKPKSGFWQHCQRLAEGPASQCVFVDDVADNIRGAKEHGWQGIVYRPNMNLEESLRGLGVLI